ncbi:MAG: PH domain-containing protein [Acidobacteria bacterium]|nr:PH domain-containing protein [Acidobacteriota bacterium]
MSRRVEEASAWVYQGVWRVLAEWFRVPRTPPALPTTPGETLRAFRPSIGFLRYLKLKFWVGLTIIDGFIVAGWLAITVANPVLGLALAPVAFIIAVLPDIVAYIAIHLQYDTTWYVLSERSIRIRSGIWIIHEITITFENVQNVSLESGPLERYFGIANVVIDTAGGGGHAGKEGSGSGLKDYHQGRIEGVDNAQEIRNLVLSRVRGSRSAGLGDDAPQAAGWTAEHVAALREIRDALGNR